jgi:hypothetical protein
MFTTALTSLNACAMSSLSMVLPNNVLGSGVALYFTVARLIGGLAAALLVPGFASCNTDTETAIGNAWLR